MEEYRFFSRKQGFKTDKEYQYKYYMSPIIKMRRDIGDNLVGLTGKEILEFYNIPNAKKALNWYFYKANINIGAGPYYYD